jgi:DNA-binding response OmpR family regulator
MDKKSVMILFNDSDPVFSRVIRVKFKNDANWDTVITTEYSEAFRIFKEIKPDLFITEILLNDNAGRNGFDLIREIKSSNDSKDVRIVVLTDLREDSDREVAKSLGVDYYFVKSEISIIQLIDEIKKIVNS